MFCACIHRSCWLKPKPALLKPLESLCHMAYSMTYYVSFKNRKCFSDLNQVYKNILTYIRTKKYNTKIFH